MNWLTLYILLSIPTTALLLLILKAGSQGEQGTETGISAQDCDEATRTRLWGEVVLRSGEITQSHAASNSGKGQHDHA